MSLYDLKENSIFTRFFTWMWGVNPTYEFKTMCPYFWSYIGSIIILPGILIFKFFNYVLYNPLSKWIDKYSERHAKVQIARLMESIRQAKENGQYYDIYKSKCWRKYRWDLYDVFPEFTNDTRYLVENKALEYEMEADIKRAETQAMMDKIKYGWIGTMVSYIMGAGVLFLIGWFVYWLLHLFTWNEFVEFSKFSSAIIAFIGIIVGLSFVLGKIFKNVTFESCHLGFVNKIVFWKYIGMFFTTCWNGIRMFFDMIGNLYTKSCPTIHWKK